MSYKLFDFTNFVTYYSCINKYININNVIDIDNVVQDVIKKIDNFVKTEITSEDNEYIINLSTTYDVLAEKKLYSSIIKIMSGLNDKTFENIDADGVFEIDNYDLNLQSDLSKLVYKYYFKSNSKYKQTKKRREQ